MEYNNVSTVDTTSDKSVHQIVTVKSLHINSNERMQIRKLETFSIVK